MTETFEEARARLIRSGDFKQIEEWIRENLQLVADHNRKYLGDQYQQFTILQFLTWGHKWDSELFARGYKAPGFIEQEEKRGPGWRCDFTLDLNERVNMRTLFRNLPFYFMWYNPYNDEEVGLQLEMILFDEDWPHLSIMARLRGDLTFGID